MEALNPMTPIQLLLTIALLTLLISWMVTFLILALRPERIKHPKILIQEAKHEQVSYTSTPATTYNHANPAPVLMQQMETVPPTHARS